MKEEKEKIEEIITLLESYFSIAASKVGLEKRKEIIEEAVRQLKSLTEKK